MLPKRSMIGAVVALVLLSQMIPSASLGVNRAAAATYCDWASFVMDVTVPDGTTLAANTPFTKTWRLKNIGTCTWTTAYSLVFYNGDLMSAPPSVPMPQTVAPGETVDISVQMVAPATPGHYRGNWKLKNASGVSFGIGTYANSVFWVDINVSTPYFEAYDFVAFMCAAHWHYQGGPIPCPFKPSVQQYGYVQRIENPILENGSPGGAPALLTVPQQKYNGIIMGVFPVMDIFRGDRFQAIIGCEYNATDCYVTYELDYLTPNNDMVTIWKFREKYDGFFYRVDVDLSRIAFKKDIRLVLKISAYGPAFNDRALWVAPRLVRAYLGPIPTNTPTATPIWTPTFTPSPTLTATLPPQACDKAEFVQDVTVPDGTTFAPGQAFTKTWRLKNVGTCTWNSSYSLAFVSGDQMGGAAASPLPSTVAPGGTIDISAYLTAPTANGSYQGYWMLRNPSGGFFGIGASGTSPFWVKINVSGAGTGGYDFLTNFCSATWTSGAGVLPCPGTDGNANGFVLRLDNPMLETGATDSRSALLTVPQAIDYGWIQGAYPPYVVQPGDRFQATIACQYNATVCDVFYRLDYQIGTGPINTLWAFRENYNGIADNVDLDLGSLVGQNVRFILTILSNGSSANDRALWVAPRIFHASGGSPSTEPPTNTPSPTPIPTDTPAPIPATATPVPPTDTPTPTATPTLDPYAGWNAYTNSLYGFTFNTPPGSVNGTFTDTHARIDLPYTSGTNLVEKYLEATVTESASVCKYSGLITTSETVTINGTQFLKETGGEGAAGNLYDFVAYSAFKPGTATCVTVLFVLHSTNPGVYTTPPPIFDMAAESAVFATIMSTFGWIPVTYQPETVSSSVFCADPKATALLQTLETAVRTSDGNLLATIVSPNHGVDVKLWSSGNTVGINVDQARPIFTNPTVYNWGFNPASVIETFGTFAEAVQPTLVDVFGPTHELRCNDPNVLTYAVTWPPAWSNVNFYQVHRPATPGIDFDMNYWLIGMEYLNGMPYLFGMIHFIWTP